MKAIAHSLLVKDGYIQIRTSRGHIGSISFAGDRCGEQQKHCRSFVKAFEIGTIMMTKEDKSRVVKPEAAHVASEKEKCPRCSGYGINWVNTPMESTKPFPCPACKGTGEKP